MTAPRNNRWLDGRDDTIWPISDHVGWTVQTAGLIELDGIYPKSGAYNQGKQRLIPPKTKVLLKHIDAGGKAYVYDYDHGVMMMPQELLEPVGK